MPSKKYIVQLSEEERSFLKEVASKGRTAVWKQVHARILLKADQSKGQASWTDEKITEAFDISRLTVERVRKNFVENGMEAVLTRKKQNRPSNQKFNGEKEAHLIAIACSNAPEGRKNWTLKLLADKMVELHYFDKISTEAIRQRLKKMNLSLG